MADSIAAHGLRVALPTRWEGRLFRRDRPVDVLGDATFGGRVHPAAYGHEDEAPNPVLHLANFALPPGRGDFGTGAVEIMADEHVFVSLVEYSAEEAGRPLFERFGVPRPDVREFAPNQLQRRLPGQLGCQTFFTHGGRAFCLYVVLGSRQHASRLVTDVHGVLDTLEVTPRAVAV